MSEYSVEDNYASFVGMILTGENSNTPTETCSASSETRNTDILQIFIKWFLLCCVHHSGQSVDVCQEVAFVYTKLFNVKESVSRR
jgi:hypothetical protein